MPEVEKNPKPRSNDLLSISDKRKISAQFIPDAGKASDIIRTIDHEGKGYGCRVYQSG